jgi:hypothetical protein
MTFTPTSVGAKNGVWTMGGSTLTLTGTGIAPSNLAITPATLSFGSVAVGGTSTAVTVTFTNPNASTLNISATGATGDVTQFANNGTGSNCGAILAANASCISVVTFTPTSAGAKTAVWTMAGSTLTLAGTGTTTPTPIYRINSGSGSAASPFTADQYFSGGTQHSVTNAINVTGVANPAPTAVYQSERYGNATYTFPGLTASTSHTVRLHFAELYQTAAGRRVFSVAINGTTVLSNFDIYVAAGGNYRAVVREFSATSSASGQIVVTFTTVTDNASISGIEIIR